jgi:hypothetical protein
MEISSQFKGQKVNILLANIVIKHNRLFIVLLSFLMLGGIMYFVAYPFYKSYQFFTKEEIPTLRQILTRENANLQALKQQYEQRKSQLLQVKLERVENLVAKNNDHTLLYLPLQEVVRAAGFTLNNFSIVDSGLSQFGERQLKAALGELTDWQVGEFTVQLDVVGGDYENIKKFLETLEKTGRLYDVVSLSFNPQSYVRTGEGTEVRAGTGGVSYNIVMKTYYILPKSAEASALTAESENLTN